MTQLHPETAAMVDAFAVAVKEKLLASQIKRGGDPLAWKNDNWKTSARLYLLDHVEKGDPLDVGAIAAFVWAHGWRT